MSTSGSASWSCCTSRCSCPSRYVLHAYLLHHFSLLLMPVLFTFFGLVIEVLLRIAPYGWAVSWNAAVDRDRDA